ncbi:hypothetical protein ACFQZ4_36225 [Catellatospora coxensis]
MTAPSPRRPSPRHASPRPASPARVAAADGVRLGSRRRGRGPMLPFVATSLLAGMVVLLLMALGGCLGPHPGAASGATPAPDAGRAGSAAGSTPSRATAACPPATVTVADGSALAGALARARPGTVSGSRTGCTRAASPPPSPAPLENPCTCAADAARCSTAGAPATGTPCTSTARTTGG